MPKHSIPFLLKSLQMNYSFLLIDEKQKIVAISDTYASLLGLDQIQSVGQPIQEELPMLDFSQIFITGEPQINVLIPYFNYEKKSKCTMVCNYQPIIQEGQVMGVLHTIIHSDIHQIKKLNEKLETLKKEHLERPKSPISTIQEKNPNLNQVFGSSKVMKDLKELVMRVANSNLSILITGETGTGKEVFANAIHQLSKRKEQPFVKINCAAIPKDLLESELFGYAEGAFSGALKGGKMGRFELANNGTILLDEIGEMPISLQAKLLRVIQEQELVRVGGLKTIKLNVRIICSTNRNLEEMVTEGNFREDLYYRINVVELPLPPLREHLEDIPDLCEHFIHESNENNELNISGIHPDVYPFLQQYDWKGNIRELEHTIERACVMCQEGILHVEHFDFLLTRIQKNHSVSDQISDSPTTLKNKKNEYEKEQIVKALAITKGNKSAAAKYLHISRSVFYTKLKNYHLL